MDGTGLRLLTDDSGGFDRLELGDEVLVSNLCPNEIVDVEGELRTRGFTCTTRDLSEFVMPVGTADEWKSQAKENVNNWGLQSAETLLLAMQEELGELTQAVLEAEHEGGDPARRQKELADLGALCFQLSWALNDRSEDTATDQEGSQ